MVRLLLFSEIRSTPSQISDCPAPERAIARHEVREIEQRHTQDGLRQRDSSLAPESDNEDDVVIIYNRVPKTASTSFTNIAYDLCGKNHYHVLHINTTKNNPVMSIQDQVRETANNHFHSFFFFFSFVCFACLLVALTAARLLCHLFKVRFVKNVTQWREMKPAFYHGHISFLDFTK